MKKLACLVVFLSFGAFAIQDCETESKSLIDQNKIVFEGAKKLADGSVWLKGVNLVDGGNLYRIKASNANAERICKALGLDGVQGVRIEFDRSSQVVSINRKLEVTRHKRFETKYIENITCRR